jgi:hypothetical protein
LYYLTLTKQTGDFPYHIGLGFEIRGLMETLFYCLQMLAKQNIRTSPCHQSMNHVRAPQNGHCVILMEGQQSSYVQAPALEITSTLSVANGTENTNSPVPAFEQGSGSTEIGCYSHEVFFSNTTEETENHQSTSNEVSIISALITTVISVQCRFPLFRINYALSSELTSNY